MKAPYHFAVVAHYALEGVPDESRRAVLEGLLGLTEGRPDLASARDILAHEVTALRAANTASGEFRSLLDVSMKA